MSLTVIAGGMFAEKSTELQRRGRRLKRARKKVAYFKPEIDNRYSENEIVTHDGAKVEAINIKTNAPIQITSREFFDNEVYLIDEVQFFHSTVLTAIETLLRAGKTVIVAGLDMDSDSNPFDITAVLMAKAEEVVKLKAVCSECGKDSWVSYNANKTDRIVIGTDDYKPMCRECYYNKTLGAK